MVTRSRMGGGCDPMFGCNSVPGLTEKSSLINGIKQGTYCVTLSWKPEFARLANLLLALWAIVRRALAELEDANRRAAVRTGFAVAAVNPERLLEVAGPAIGILKIAQRGAAGPDRLFQGFADRRRQLLILCAR